jgi:hypothetical protein
MSLNNKDILGCNSESAGSPIKTYRNLQFNIRMDYEKNKKNT